MPKSVGVSLVSSDYLATGIREQDFQFKIVVKDSSGIKPMLDL